MLTRRDQLKLKESKQAEKQAKKSKSKTKAAEPDEGGDQEPEHVQKKPRRQRKPKVDENQPEENKEPQESKPPSKSVSRRKAAPKPAAEPEMAVADVPEAMPDEAVPGKRRARSKSKVEPKDPKPKKAPKNADGKSAAKAKAKSSSSKSKPGRKAKALSDANTNVEQNSHEEDESVAGETDTATPKKKLFQSDEETGDEGGHDSPHERLDSKTGEVKPLAAIFEQDKPSEWIATRPGKKKVEKKTKQASAASAAAAASSNEAGGKPAKAKAKSTKRSKQELSPFAKKENKRRKKAELATMQESPQEDLQVQGIFLQYMKQCKDLTYDGLKEYLYKNLPHQFNHGKLNPYFSRPACGVQVDLKTGKPGKLTEIVYFGRCGTANSFNAMVVTAYVSGHLMAFWLNDLVQTNYSIM